MPPRREVPWDATVAEHLGVAEARAAGAGGTSQHLGGTGQVMGQVIDGRYRIIELLGEGGMGAVYVAEHLKLRKQVAIKVIRAEFASNAQASARFDREALATAQIDHPHVASAIDSGKLPDGSAYLVIQLVRGVSLARHLDTHGKLGWGAAAELGSQIADALAAAHAVGIVHRDLKPDNILIETRDDGRLHARVVDFGIARVVEDVAPTTGKGLPLTRMGSILGTPGYMPPEQAVGDTVDARGDLYALGVIVWECCVGRRLWQGESVTELVACQLGSTPPTLQQELRGQAPEALSNLIAELLSPAPSKRPGAAGPVRDALRRLALNHTAPPTRGTIEALPSALRPTRSRWTDAAALLQRRGVLAALAVGLALLVTCVLLRGPSVPSQAPATAIVASATSPQPAPIVAPSVAPIVAPSVTPSVTPSVAPSVGVGTPAPIAPTQPAPTPVATPTPPAPAAPEELSVPEALTADLTALLASEDKRGRKRAADHVLAFTPKESVPLYLRNLAWLEKAGSCANKREVIEQMEAAGDVRVLPALRRLSATRRRGCGFFSSQDCLACLRETLARAIGRLDTAAAPAPSPAP